MVALFLFALQARFPNHFEREWYRLTAGKPAKQVS